MTDRRVKLEISSSNKANLVSMAAADQIAPIFRLTSQAKLAANAGDWQWADAIIEQLAKMYESTSLPGEEAGQIEATMAMCSRFQILSHLIAMRDRQNIKVRFDVKRMAYSRPFSKFEVFVTNPTECLIVFDESTFTSYDPEFFLRRSLFMIPLLYAFIASQFYQPANFVIDVSDHGSEDALSFSGHRIANLIPDPIFIHERGYDHIKQQFNTVSPIEWKDRVPVVFWRGTTTGEARDWRQLPRVKLCNWAKHSKFRPRLDIAISGIVQRSAGDNIEIQESGFLGAYVPSHEFNRFKYHVDIDGNTNSWPGLMIKLASGSPVLKVTSERGYMQWFYERLRPWENFVPVKPDLSDIDEVLDWMFTHDNEAEAIGRAGAKLAEDLSLDAELTGAAATIRRMSNAIEP